METFFSYETAKHTLVLATYWGLITLDIWWLSYLIVHGLKWIVKKLKGLFQKKQPEEVKEADN